MKSLLVGGVAAALTVTGVLVAGPTSAAPPADADTGPVTKGATWLSGQVPASGVFHIYSEYLGDVYESDDVGLTIDGAWSLVEVGGHAATVTEMTEGIEAGMPDYYSSFGTTYANSTAKGAAYLLERGRTGATTEAALAALVSTVSDTAPIAGRVEDQNGYEGADYATPLGQAYAVQALAEADEPQLEDARSYLLDQQCAAGFFRGGFASDKEAVDQTCDGAATGEGGSSVDTTAFTILALQDLAATDTGVASALDDAAAWLADVQGTDGSFSTGGTTGPVNANSTGLAGRALGAEGLTSDAAETALWLRAHQLNNAGACQPFARADDGAIVVDDLGVANARAGAFDDIDRSVALRATAQALPALAYAPGGLEGAGETRLVVATEPVRAGTTRTVVLRGAPGNTLCLRIGRASPRTVVLPASGRSEESFALPKRTQVLPITTYDAARRSERTSITALWTTQFDVTATSPVTRGNRAVVRASGLVPNERFVVRFRGRDVASGNAGGGGRVVESFVASGRTGRAAVVVVGQFSDRRGSAVVTVR